MSGDLALLFEAWRRLLLARAALTLLPWRAASRLLTASPHGRSTTSPERLTRAVHAASRFVPRSTCLVKALALQALLARRGGVGILHVGVKTTQVAGFEAHAWLELDGEIVIGEGARHGFAPLLSHRADR
jgi:transglutaminase superfamily protein